MDTRISSVALIVGLAGVVAPEPLVLVGCSGVLGYFYAKHRKIRFVPDEDVDIRFEEE